MTAKIIHFPIWNMPVSLEDQIDKREEIILQVIMKTYADEFTVGVGLACTAASDCLADGGSDQDAFRAAEKAIVDYREKLLRKVSGIGHE